MASPTNAPAVAIESEENAGSVPLPIKIPTNVIVTEPGTMVPISGNDSENA
ncbi:MAG: hypothetical protein ACD_42C00459G0001, partial [uncultured bacterium]